MGSRQLDASVNLMVQKISDMGKEISKFSHHLSGLYRGEINIPNSAGGREYKLVRNEIATQGVIYSHLVMPINRTCVSKLQMFAEMYEHLNFETWRQNIDSVREKTETFYKYFSALLYIHEGLLLEQAYHVQNKAQKLQNSVRNEKANLEGEIERNKGAISAWWLMLVPVVNVVALPFVASAQIDNNRQVDQMKLERSKTIDMGNAIQGNLIPGFENHINGLKAITSFFYVMQEELKQCVAWSQYEQKLNYDVLRGKAHDIKFSCRQFVALIPDISHNFSFISDNDVNWQTYDWFLEARNDAVRSICGPFKSIDLIN